MKYFQGTQNYGDLELAKLASLPSKKWTILHPKFYANYPYTDHKQKLSTKFEHTVLSVSARFALLIQ